MSKILTLALVALAIGLTACGGSSSSPSPTATASPTAAAPTSTSAAGGGSTLSLAADPSGQLRYDKTALTATAGKVTINFTNNASLTHNVTIQQGTSGPSLGATPTFAGGTKTLTVTLKPGTYTFYCSVPGHRAAGMHGTLVVK